MKQRIIIKNFGPIKDVDLEINDFMVFIGPQASGKSTIAKLVYFFRNIDEFIVESSLEYFSTKNFDNSKVRIGFERAFLKLDSFVPTDKYFKIDTEIVFFYNENSNIRLFRDKESIFSFKVENNRFVTQIIEEIKILYSVYNGFKRDLNFELSSRFKQIRDNLKDDICKYIENEFKMPNQLKRVMIPDNRFSYTNSVQQKGSDFIGNAFTKEVDDLRYFVSNTYRVTSETSSQKSIDKLSKNVLKGEYTYSFDNKDEIILSFGNTVSMKDTSSGQKEAVWIIQYIQKALLEKSSAFTIIEEPEAHLFPAAQKSLTELIALLANSAENQVMLTTHSPYILAAINNLMQAYKAGQSHPDKTNEIINKELWLDPKRVSAYFVGGEGNEGKIKDIIDDDLDFIKVEEIDSISSVFNSDFDKLTDLEYNVVS